MNNKSNNESADNIYTPDEPSQRQQIFEHFLNREKYIHMLKNGVSLVESEFERRFPKQDRALFIEKIVENLNETKTYVEVKARTLAEKSKSHSIMAEYVRPFIGSEQTEQFLESVEKRLIRVAPVIRSLRELRERFLDATAKEKTQTLTQDESLELKEQLNNSSKSKKRRSSRRADEE